jgi:hypothetical protein
MLVASGISLVIAASARAADHPGLAISKEHCARCQGRTAAAWQRARFRA